MVPMLLTIPGAAITGGTAAVPPQGGRHQRSATCIIFSVVRCSRRWGHLPSMTFGGRLVVDGLIRSDKAGARTTELGAGGPGRHRPPPVHIRLVAVISRIVTAIRQSCQGANNWAFCAPPVRRRAAEIGPLYAFCIAASISNRLRSVSDRVRPIRDFRCCRERPSNAGMRRGPVARRVRPDRRMQSMKPSEIWEVAVKAERRPDKVGAPCVNCPKGKPREGMV